MYACVEIVDELDVVYNFFAQKAAKKQNINITIFQFYERLSRDHLNDVRCPHASDLKTNL